MNFIIYKAIKVLTLVKYLDRYTCASTINRYLKSIHIYLKLLHIIYLTLFS